MRIKSIFTTVLAAGLLFGGLSMTLPAVCRADDKANQQAARDKAREKWEAIVLFFGDEETGEWSLRIRDKDATDRAWFEFEELWHFNVKEKRWEQLKTEKIAHAIVLPKQKTSDQPEDSQTLIELKEIEPKTPGIWFAKWKVDEVACSTFMRVGTWRVTNKVEGDTPKGMMKMAVPLTLDKSELMFIPDPRVYCIIGGPGKPDAKPAAKSEGK